MILGSFAHAQDASSPSGCGNLANAYGPYDYRTDKHKLGIVENYHFTAPVEALTRGATSSLPGGDLNYTLHAFPNHHRALLAMVRYAEKMNSTKPRGASFTVECYFDRAMRFRPDDVVVRLLYVQYLIKSKRTKDAAAQLTYAETYAKDDGYAHYYIGLLYYDLKNNERALSQAHKAQELGYDITELRDLLTKAGQWAEPAPRAAASSASAPAAEAEPPKP